MATATPTHQISPETCGLPVHLKPQYENFIGGQWTAPTAGQYFSNVTPVTGELLCRIPRSGAADINQAIDAAHAAKASWGRTSTSVRARILEQIAQRIEDNLDFLATVETWDNGKPIRETRAADLPLCIEHFRYFAGCIRAQEGGISEIDRDTIAYHFHEPLGVVAMIIPWNFPLLMATWKLAPALAAGNTIVLKPAEQTPMSILVLLELIADLLPPGVLNVVNGFGLEAGKPLASSPRVNKVAFTGETTTGRLIMQYASQNIIPVTLELGGKSPNIFFADVMNEDDAFFDKCLEGFAMFALNQGEVCTCPPAPSSRSPSTIVSSSAPPPASKPSAAAPARRRHHDRRPGLLRTDGKDPLLLRHRKAGRRPRPHRRQAIRRRPRRRLLHRAHHLRRPQQDAHLPGGDLRPVVSVTTFKDEDDAMSIANDTLYGLGSGVWTRDINRAYNFGRGIQAGRVWTNCYHLYPAHAAFGGYKQSGIGRENHKMMLDHYQQTKNQLISYSPNAMGFF